jgi:hypothetical protein
MTQRDRDRPVVLKKAQKKLITQKQSAIDLGLSERHIRRMLVRLREPTTWRRTANASPRSCRPRVRRRRRQRTT